MEGSEVVALARDMKVVGLAAGTGIGPVVVVLVIDVVLE